MKRLLGLIGACVLGGGLLLVAMVTWMDHQAVYAEPLPAIPEQMERASEWISGPRLVQAQTIPASCTPITQDITSDETWTDPCYRVEINEVTVLSILTISPPAGGTWVVFTGNAKLHVVGNLQALGTAQRPITFTSGTPQPGRCDWQGISFGANSVRNRIQHSTIEYACTGIEPSGSTNSNDGDWILSNTLRYNGNGGFSGGIGGDIDYSHIENNVIYSCSNGIALNEAGHNEIISNTIRDIDHYGLTLTRGGVGGGTDNNIFDNDIHDCVGGGLRLEEGSYNNVFSNTIYLNSGGAIYLFDQILTNVQHNHIYNNGSGSGYQAAIYVTGTNSIIGDIAYNVIYDTVADAVEFNLGATPLNSRPMAYNALCSIPSLELRNDTGASVTAPHNWWGANTPMNGVNYIGSVDPDPPIMLSLEGNANGDVTVWLRDSDGNTVPPPPTRQTTPPAPNAREIELSTNWGAFSLDTVEVNDLGIATTIWNPGVSPAPDTIVITATGFCDYSVIDTIPLPDLVITKTTALTEVVCGGLLDYAIDYCNVGDETAENVEITDILPPWTTYVSNSNGPCLGCVLNGTGPLAWNVGSLPAGACGSFTLRLRADSNAPCGTLLINTVNISTTTFERDTTNNEDTASVDVVGPDVTITKAAAPPQVVRGGVVNYTITYRNGGNAPAEDVVVTDGPDMWPIGTLDAGASGSFAFTRIVPLTAICGTQLTNIATIATTTPECGALPNQDSASVEIVGPDVTVGKTTVLTEVLRGDVITYTITYRNGGDAPAENVEITDVMPPGTSYVSDDGGLTCVGCGGPGPLSWDAGTLPANSPSYSFNLILRVNSSTPCSTTLVNTATIATTTPECGALPNQDQSEAVHVTGHVDLVVLKDDDVGPSMKMSLTADKQAALNRLLRKSRGYSPLAVSQHRDFVLEGDLVTYTISIVNVGDYTATNVVLSETLPLYTQYVGINWTHVAGRTYTQTVGTLLPGAGRIYYFVVRIDDPIPLGVNDLDNLVCGWSDDDLHPEDNCNHEDTPVRHPRLTITKTGDALSKVGDDVVYTIMVCNPGDVDLIKQSVADNLIPGVNAVFGPSLAPGVCESHDFPRTVQPGDPDPLVNVATARYYVDGRPDRALVASDDHSVNLFQPRVEVEKGGDTLSKVGDAVIYHFWITNTSSADSPDLILESVLDTLMGNVTGGFSAACGRLAPGESCHVAAGYTVQPGDPDPLLNTVTVLYHPEGFPNDITASDSHSVNLFQPSLTFDKSGDALSKVGDDVNYALTLVNTSSADTPNLECTITDAMLGINENVTLASGTGHVINATYTVPAGASDPLVNTAQASCSPIGFPNVLTASDDHVVELFQPSITFDKSGDVLSKGGDPTAYTLTLNNTSSADTPNLVCTITDGMLGINETVALASGASHVINASYVVPAGASDPLVNTAQVSCSPVGFPNILTASDSHSVNLFQPSITFDKTGDALSKAGDDVNYTLTLVNTSSADTPNLECTITDAMVGINENVTLPSGTGRIVNATYTVPAGTPDPLVNTAQVSCSPVGFPNVLTASDSHSVNLFQPSIILDKTGDALSKVGDSVNYTLTLNNTSSADAPNLVCTISDAMVGINESVTLASGASHVINATYTVPAGAPDPLVNTAQASCSPVGFPNVLTVSASHSVNLFQPSITFDKSGDPLSKVGDPTNYALTLVNISSADTPNLECTITDAMLGINESVVLPSGTGRIVNAVYTVPAGAPDPLLNTAQVSCSPIGFPNVLTASDNHSVNLFQPGVEVEKTGPESAYVDNTITYTFRITNTGSADSPALILDSVTDVGDGWPGLGDLTAVARANGCDSLPPGNSCNFDVPYTIQPGDPNPLTNTVTVNFYPNGFTNVITHSDYHTVVTSIDVDLVVTKNDDVGPTTPTSARLAADKQAAVDRLLRAAQKRAPLAPAQLQREFVGPGDLITFTIVVINTGQSVATNVVLTETLPLYTTYVGYGWQQVGATRNYTMSLPNLPPQVGRVVTFVVRIDDPLPPEVRSIINYVCGFSAEPDSDDTDNCRYTDAPVLNLDVDKEANPTAILPGDQVTFTITLSNPNQFTGSITITDDLPDGFTWITDTAETIGLTRVLTAPVVIWRASTFTIGERISFTLTAQASPTIACGDWVTNVVTATVRIGNQEYNWMATAGVWIQCHIDLLVTKDDDVGPITSMSIPLAANEQAVVDRLLRTARERAPLALAQHREFVEPGDLITYTITIANVGAYTVTNAVLSDTIPLYTEYVGYGWTNLGGRTYITTVGTLPPGVGRVYFLVVRVSDSLPFGVSNLINHVCGWGDEPDDYLDNNCNYEDTPVRTGAKLYVTNRGEDPDGPAGSGIPGTIDVFNTTNFDHITTIPDVGEDPWGMATRDRYLFETDFDEVDSQSALYVVDTINDTVVASVTLACRHPAHVAVYDGYVYVACHSGPPPIEVIRAEPPWDIVDELYLNQHQVYEFGLFGVTADTNRGLIYFTKSDFGGLGIWALNPSSGTLTYYSTAGEKPFSILYNPNDDLVYVAFAQLGQVWVFDPDGFQLLERIDTETQETVDEGHGGQGLVALGQCVFASNYLSASVTVIVNGSCVEPVAVHVTAPPAGFERIYLPMVVNDFSGQPVQPAQPNVVTISLNGRRPKGMTAAHNRLFVTLPLEDRVAIIDTETLTVIGEIAVIGEHPHTVILVEAD